MNEPKQVFDAKAGVMRTVSTWNPLTKEWEHPEEEKPEPVRKKAKKKAAKKKR